MRIVKYIVLAVLLLCVGLLTAALIRWTGWPDGIAQYWSHGRLGNIDGHEGLFALVGATTKNELIVGRYNRWVGLDASRPEIAIFFDHKVWSPGSLPEQFDLSKSIVISFEKDRIVFFHFPRMQGGYYMRLSYYMRSHD
ncbi:MAG: hypothetical protein ABSG25_06045 [Bryobacteraceae bacterium]